MTEEQFLQLLEKFHRKQLTPEELLNFLQAAEEERFESLIIQRLQQDLEQIRRTIAADAETQSKVWKAVRRQTALSSQHTTAPASTASPAPSDAEQAPLANSADTAHPVVHRIGAGRKWRWAAAAVVAMALFSVFYWFPRNEQKEQGVAVAPPTIPTDIQPGGDKAILTLADGSTIVLDSTGKGILARQGSVQIVKQADGQLSYIAAGQSNNQPMTNTMRTPRGGQYQLTLPDGTKVWLNAISSITYPTLFVGNQRKVKISGEAYFEVRSDPKRPFVVEAGNMKVQVLGTHFNVMAYEDEMNIVTTLVEGRVDILHDNRKTPLTPGDQAHLSPNGEVRVIGHADLQEALAWKNGYFQFTSANMNTILHQLSRWYDADFVYNNDIPLHFTGQLRRNRTLSELFNELAMTGELQFQIEGRKIIVSP